MNLRVKRLSISIMAATLISSTFAAVEAPFEVGTWGNFCKGAVSHTFDDYAQSGTGQVVDQGQKAFDDKGFRMTIFTLSGSNPNWSKLKAAFEKGHEIGSHTVTHNSSDNEFENSWKSIRQNVPGEKCVSVAYPNCQQNNANTFNFYIAGRNCNASINPKTPSNFAQINSKMFGRGSCNCPNDEASLNSFADQAANGNGWAVYCHHGIGSDNHSWAITSLDEMKKHLDYLDKNRDKIWVETFGNVARYIKERDAVSIEVKSSSDKKIVISVKDNLPDSIYNYPLSIRRPLPDGWLTAIVAQNGEPVDDTIVTINSKSYVMFKAVPDGGDVEIFQDPTYIKGSRGKSLVSSASPVKFHKRTIEIDPSYFSGSEMTVELFDLKGKVVGRYNLRAGQASITLSKRNVSASALIANISDGNTQWRGKIISQ